MKTKKQQTILKGVNTTKAAECHRLKGGESPISSSKSWGGLITPSTTSLKWWIPSTHKSMSEFATVNWATARSKLKVRKTTRRGGWIVFLETSSLRSEELFSGSESEVVESLSELRVFVQRINVKNRRRNNTSSYTGSFHKPEVVLSSLHFQGEFH